VFPARQLRRAIFDDAVEILAREYSRPIRIEEIARRVGYGDLSQFSKAFSRAYGVSPWQAPRSGGLSRAVDG
jgi:AraC-like DNA-binding protein